MLASNKPILEFLISKGAITDCVSKECLDVLDFAEESNSSEMVEFIGELLGTSGYIDITGSDL